MTVEKARSRLRWTCTKRHDRADEGRDDADADQQGLDDVDLGAEHRSEDRPVHACGCVQAELDHHAREEHADGRRRDSVSVGQPEVERYDGALDEEAEHDQDERHDDQAVEVTGRQRPTDRRQVQRTGAGVQQCDAREDHERADAVGDGEVQRSLERARFLGLVAGEAVGGDAHQLEVHEHVEQVAAQAEGAHRSQEHEHQASGRARRPRRSTAR